MLLLRAAVRHNHRPNSHRGNGITNSHRPLQKSSTRHLQTKTVTDADVARLAARPRHLLTLADLCKHGRPPLSEHALLNSANFTLKILPSRLAHRIQSLRALPYIVVANANVRKIHSNYVHSLSTIIPFAERTIETLEEEIKFTEVMADIVQTHSNTIAILARGFLEARKYISKDEITRFLDEHLRARIGTRLIAEQQLALHFSSKPHTDLSGHTSQDLPSYIGVIDTELKPAEIIRTCEHMVGEICELKYGVRPSVNIIGAPETRIAHIPMHLEYILTELLKNSFRATIEAGMEKEPIEVTIAPTLAVGNAMTDPRRERQTPSNHKPGVRPDAVTNCDQEIFDYASEFNTREQATSANIRPLEEATPGVTIRIRDRGGGISPENYAKLWEYGFTTFNEDEIMDNVSGGRDHVDALDAISGSAAGGSSLAGLGYGLPLGRAYAEYFGGGIAIQSLWGWGTDVYLSLRGVGKIDHQT